MQVTSKRHSMVVEFRPHNILTDKFVYTLKFKGDAQSMRLMSKKEMIETVNARLDLHGYDCHRLPDRTPILYACLLLMFIDTDRQLRKLSIFKPMNFRIVEIDFDFDDAMTNDDQQEIVDEVMSTTWSAVDGDDLVEEITSATGWCINSIDYCYVLS